ncbi:SRPBCC domain-containing protein [Fictibacillus sp. KIGAM418]|uniref:SRPBCC domain-containing protein n=1 Tax=Fictibacillus marinisediminis TaxID=2878389 RepID=A0A9X2BFI8_9BACL|nr:SRPBCC domain-containing protein [Fictibacillus marinisediminis]MCK6255538.1 SRPBCC domain-containing protein [Fictibacillus marinisediminis]
MSVNYGTKSLKTAVEGKVLMIERVFNAPKDIVFKAFSQPEHLSRWWGPKGWETDIRQFDFQPGGVWLYCMKCVDKNQGDFYGQESCGKAVYQEIVAPEKVVYKDFFTDGEGNEMEGMPGMLVTLEFTEYEGATKVITRSEFVTEEALKQVKDMGVVEGFSSQMERLDDLLEQLQ